MRKFILCFALLSFSIVKAQTTTIPSGEKLTFVASYNMSGLLTDLAEVTMETSTVNTARSSLLRLKCTAATYSKWDNFFKIRDLYESYVSPKTLTPFLHKREINEGGYYKFMQYKFNHNTKTVESLKRKKRKNGTTWEEKSNFSTSNFTRDLVSTLYKLRTFDFSKVSVGQSKTFLVIFDNEEHAVNFKYLGTETINTNLGRKECYKLAISINTSDVLKGNNDNLLWLTADAHKIPVYGKFRIAVGSGELKIKSATGLK